MSFVVFLDVDGVLNNYDIKVLGSTQERWGSQREEGIKDYLNNNPEVDYEV